MQMIKSLSIRTIVLFVASVLALTLCFTGTARAALAYFSPDYQAEFATSELDVALTEAGEKIVDGESNGEIDEPKIVEGDDALLGWMEGVTIVPGKEYKEVLAAKNVGDYDQYVRVVVKKYWTDADGNKTNTIDPALIQLETAAGWTEDTVNRTDEQVVLYSTELLPVGASRDFVKSLRIDPAIVTDVKARETKEVPDGNKTIFTTTYTLDGYSFNIECEVDAVQTHNAPDAIKSVWGYTVSENELS